MKCPGQDTRYWKPGDIYEAPCPNCGKSMEFFKDDTNRTCTHCGKKVLNPRLDFGCASYCSFADQCLKELPPEILAEHKDLLKDRVAIAMKRFFGNDFKRIGHAVRVARYAEEIALEEGADMAVVIIAAYLHDIGIKEAQEKHNSTAAALQEELGPPAAKTLLESLGAPPELTAEVCDIIGHHHSPRAEETLNYKTMYDADLLANLEEHNAESPLSAGKADRLVQEKFFTKTGQILARKQLADPPRS